MLGNSVRRPTIESQRYLGSRNVVRCGLLLNTHIYALTTTAFCCDIYFRMHVKNTLFTAAAALSAGVAADFLVVTNYPQALQTLSPEQVCRWYILYMIIMDMLWLICDFV